MLEQRRSHAFGGQTLPTGFRAVLCHMSCLHVTDIVTRHFLCVNLSARYTKRTVPLCRWYFRRAHERCTKCKVTILAGAKTLDHAIVHRAYSVHLKCCKTGISTLYTYCPSLEMGLDILIQMMEEVLNPIGIELLGALWY